MKKYSLYLIAVLAFLMSCSEKPKELLNTDASIQQSDELKENPLLMHPITSSVQPTDSIMSTLYGNDIAFEYAKRNLAVNYPEGSVLYEVNWKQKPDELWFGANVPKEILSVEKITVDKGFSKYELFEGKTLKKIDNDEAKQNLRKDHILSQRMAVSP